MYVRDGTTHFSDTVAFWGLWSKAFFFFELGPVTTSTE